MTGLLSSLLTSATGWLADSAVALTATALLVGWWVAVALLTLRARGKADGPRSSAH